MTPSEAARMSGVPVVSTSSPPVGDCPDRDGPVTVDPFGDADAVDNVTDEEMLPEIGCDNDIRSDPEADITCSEPKGSTVRLSSVLVPTPGDEDWEPRAGFDVTDDNDTIAGTRTGDVTIIALAVVTIVA